MLCECTKPNALRAQPETRTTRQVSSEVKAADLQRSFDLYLCQVVQMRVREVEFLLWIDFACAR
jgi:hypothetical protein